MSLKCLFFFYEVWYFYFFFIKKRNIDNKMILNFEIKNNVCWSIGYVNKVLLIVFMFFFF